MSRGFTIVELCCSCVLLATFAASSCAFLAQVDRSGRAAAAYVADLGELRRAIARLEADVRCATAVEATAGGARLVLAGETVEYTVAEGELRRGAVVVGRRIARLIVSVDDRVVAFTVALLPRAVPGRAVSLASKVALVEGP